MTYQYVATEEERAAEALLREKGWSVSAPSCPKCHGFGRVMRFERFDIVQSVNPVDVTSTSVTYSPCPNGCETPAMYFPVAV